MSLQKISIMAAGSLPDEYNFYRQYLENTNYKIAADAGLNVFYTLNIIPDLWVGDGDSVGNAAWQWAEQNNIPIRKYSCDKDSTDTEIALDIAITQHPQQILILGGIGSRLDHTLGNLFLLEYAYEKGANAILINPWHTVQLLTPSSPVEISGKPGDTVSIIPITKTITELNLEGFHWPLSHATLQRGPTLAISNKLEQPTAKVFLKDGLAFIVQAKEK